MREANLLKRNVLRKEIDRQKAELLLVKCRPSSYTNTGEINRLSRKLNLNIIQYGRLFNRESSNE